MAKSKPKSENPKASSEVAKESKPKVEAKKTAAAPASPASTAGKAKKPATKSPAQPGGMPMIDTSLAAQAAAKMVANRDFLHPTKPQASGGKKESGSFKQLKDSFHKPAVQGPGGVLTQQNSQKKTSTGFDGRKLVGHNQTFGADVNRAGVPRRTGGG